MKKITSITSFATEVGNMLSFTYTEIDDNGNIIKRNAKEQKVIMDAAANAHVKALTDFAQTIVDGE